MKRSVSSSKVVLAALVLTALHVVFTVPPASAAAVRWASPTGTPGAACTQVDPCDLDTAVEDPTVADGDEVVVIPGDYTVGSLIVNKAITMHGQAGQPRPTITTTESFGVFMTAPVIVRDLDFVHTANSHGLSPNAAGAVIERVMSTSTAGGAIACSPYASSTWRDSVCRAIGVNTMAMGTNGMPAPGTYQLTLRNLTLVGEDRALEISVQGAGYVVQVDAKNLIATSAGYDIRALGTTGASVTITLAGSSYADVDSVGAGTITAPGTGGNLTAEPVFVDAANGDFHQAAGSPTIDAGVADVANGATDLDGDPRVARGPAGCPAVVDIGADERVTALECDPPDTSITSGPDATTTDTTPTFELSTDEPGAFECRVDGGAFAPCPTPYTTELLGLGDHTIQARATDLSGNVDPTPATRSFTVLAQPDTTFTQTPKKKVRTTKKKAKVTFAFTSTTAGGFECSLDGKAFTSCASPLTFKAKLGKHEFRVRAVSTAGVADPTPATYTFKVKRKR